MKEGLPVESVPFYPRKQKLSWKRQPANYRSDLTGSGGQPQGNGRALCGPGEQQLIPDGQRSSLPSPKSKDFYWWLNKLRIFMQSRRGMSGENVPLGAFHHGLLFAVSLQNNDHPAPTQSLAGVYTKHVLLRCPSGGVLTLEDFMSKLTERKTYVAGTRKGEGLGGRGWFQTLYKRAASRAMPWGLVKSVEDGRPVRLSRSF